MKKLKDLMLIVVIVFIVTFLTSLIIKLLINHEESLFNLQYYLTGLSLPIIQLYLEKNFTKKRLLISSIGYPIIITIVIYYIHRQF